MNIRDFQRLSAEHAAVKGLLDQIPTENAIDRLGLEYRASELEEQLSARVFEPSTARLTFRGDPTVGSHGIVAEFGAQAVRAFADAIAKISANLVGPLGARGVVAKREEYELLITGTVPGSFGFELEERAHQRSLYFESSIVGEAIERAISLMRGATGTDDQLEDAAAGIGERAVSSLRDFVKILADNRALCSVASDKSNFAFSDLSQVTKGIERLSQDHLRETMDELTGEFQGVLPKGRTFEFKLSSTGEIIRGKVGPGIADAGEINEILRHAVTASMAITRVGERAPRYQLLSFDLAEPPASDAASIA